MVGTQLDPVTVAADIFCPRLSATPIGNCAAGGGSIHLHGIDTWCPGTYGAPGRTLGNMIPVPPDSEGTNFPRGPPPWTNNCPPPPELCSKLTLIPLSSVLALLLSECLVPVVGCRELPEGQEWRLISSLFSEDVRLSFVAAERERDTCKYLHPHTTVENTLILFGCHGVAVMPGNTMPVVHKLHYFDKNTFS